MSQSIKKEWSTIKVQTRQGFLLVEVLLASSMFVLLIAAFSAALFFGQQSSSTGGDQARAISYAEEGQEAVRSMKNINFANITDGTHGLAYSNNAWSFSGTQDTSGLFTRTVVVTPVDANRKTVTTTVTWQATPQRTGSIVLTQQLTNWKTILNLGVGLTVNSIVINHGQSKIASDFAPYKVGTTTVTLATSTKFAPGTYTVTETTDPNYTTTFTGDCNASGQVTLASTTARLCTITNEEKLAYIMVTKTVINHTLSKIASDFAPFKVGSTTVTLTATTTINSGTYSVTESTSSLFSATYSGGCFTNGTVTLAPGDTKNCIITNEENVAGYTGTSLAGLIIYGDGTSVPKYRTFNHITNTFGAETPTFTATIGPTWLIRTSPKAHIALAGYYDASSNLTIMCFDGTTWTKEFTAQSGGVGNRHRFDIAFEKHSGDALVFYSKGAYANGKLGYRTKSGATGCGAANWSAESIYTPLRTTNDIMYVKMAQDRRASSDIIAATWVDINDDISAVMWNGSAWVNEPSAVTDTSVQTVSSSHDIEDMDIDFESLSGNVMLVWGNSTGNNGTNGVRYRRCTGGVATCTWGAVTTPPTFLDDATTLDISANPNTNEIVFASIGKGGGDLQLGYWDGSAWTDTANADVTCTTPYVASKLVATGWLTSGTTTRSVIVYSDLTSPNINWYTGNAGVFTHQSDFVASPGIVSPQGYIDIHMNPLEQDQLMYVTSDSASDLFAKRLMMTGPSTFVWTNSDGVALEKTLPQVISSPFSFAFWQY
jgi:hypothetical protein